MESTGHIVLVSAHVAQIFVPIRLYLDQELNQRDPLLLPTLLNALDDLAHFLRIVVKHRIPHQAYREHILAVIGFQDRLCAYQRSLTDAPAIVAPNLTRSLEGGRPTVSIPAEQLVLYTNLGFHDKDIARLLGTSRSTITRRRKELGLQKRREKHLVPQDRLEAVSARAFETEQGFSRHDKTWIDLKRHLKTVKSMS